ncbi:MAG: hypothetical protein IIA62_10255 [Nitrospinae bacterium]|nr:hypothetical protein [Nitrospinota bacterium]
MKLKMLETRSGSPDGVSTVLYEKDREYELPDDLACVFIKETWARTVGKKDLGSAPENKSVVNKVKRIFRKKIEKKNG